MRSRFVSIWFKNLDVDWLLRKRADLRTEPVAFQTVIRNKLSVIALNDLARGTGIREGTSIADTKFLSPTLNVFDHDEKLSPALLTILTDWCIRYTPTVAIDPPDGILLDVTGCTHLHGSEKRFLSHLVKKILSLGYTARAAMADTPGAAWAVARYGCNQPIIPVSEGKTQLAALPIQALRLSPATIDKLDGLGLRSVAQLYPIPRPMLLKRYGQEVVLRLDQALGIAAEYVKPRVPAPDLSVRLDIIETVSTPEGIALAAEQLIERLCELLDKRQHGVRQMHLHAYRIDGNLQTLVIGTASPTRSATHLYRLLKEKLGTLEPGLGFELFVLSAYVVNPLIAQQSQLLPDAEDGHRQATLELIDRIAVKLGAKRVMRFEPVESHWPTRAYLTKIASDKARTAWPKQIVRPARLLQTPVEIQVLAPVPDYPPKRFRYDGRLHDVRLADGPERIEGEWWLQNREMRDYYRLEDNEGRRYWVYRSGRYETGHAPQWFLHGFF